MAFWRLRKSLGSITGLRQWRRHLLARTAGCNSVYSKLSMRYSLRPFSIQEGLYTRKTPRSEASTLYLVAPMTISPCPLPAEARNFPQVPRPDREASPLLRAAGRTQEARGSRAVCHSERGRTRQGACSPSIHISGRTAWVRPRTSYAVQECVNRVRTSARDIPQCPHGPQRAEQ